MTEKITEQNVWDFLSATEKPIVLYGMGNGAEKILQIFESKNIVCSGIFASDGFVRGHSFRGYKVKTYAQIEREYDDFIVVLAFATRRPEVIENILKISRRHTVLAPDVPVAGLGLFSREFVAAHDGQFDAAYELLKDDFSRKNYINILNFKVSGKIEYLFPFCEKSKVYNEFLNFKNETVLDLGAYDGDTIREFIAADKNYKKIYAFEPDEKNFKKLNKKCDGLRDICAYNLGAWDKEDTAFFEQSAGRNSALAFSGKKIKLNAPDNIVDGPVSVIKMDIEGSELKALEGCKNLIKKYKPKLYICAYHRNEDMFALPLKVHEIAPEYTFYFAHHEYIPAWESNFYGTAE